MEKMRITLQHSCNTRETPHTVTIIQIQSDLCCVLHHNHSGIAVQRCSCK